MPPKLTIVVTCTDRKSLPVSDGLFLREVPFSGGDRCVRWTERLEAARTRKPLRELYQGESWSLLPALEEAALSAGFEPQVVVASAGLGLCALTFEAPAYSATFSSRQPDSVGGTLKQQQAWWNRLNQWNGSSGLLPDGDQALFVLSRRYAEVLSPVVARTASERRTLVIGGSSAVGNLNRLPTDVQLRSALGGTRGALNMRMAVTWLQRLTSPDVGAKRALQTWALWAQEVRRAERYDRSPLSDQEVARVITEIRAQEPKISKTRALRILRTSGYACEQKRFGALFDDGEESGHA